eukprot:1158138-Pelagomonas_calceolata.AAC.1
MVAFLPSQSGSLMLAVELTQQTSHPLSFDTSICAMLVSLFLKESSVTPLCSCRRNVAKDPITTQTTDSESAMPRNAMHPNKCLTFLFTLRHSTAFKKPAFPLLRLRHPCRQMSEICPIRRHR